MSSVTRRLIAGFGANAFGRVATTFIQLCSVPVYLSHWGTSLYGEWLLLYSIPSYFLLSDIGFGTVAGNEMTMLVAAGNHQEAKAVFQSAWVLITAISISCMFLVLGSFWFLPFDRWFHLHLLTLRSARYAILLLTGTFLLALQETLFQSAFRCVGKYAYGTVAKSVLMVLSFAVVMMTIICGGQLTAVALALFLSNGLGTVVLWILLRHNIRWLRLGVEHASLGTIYRLASPAVSFMCFPMATALSLQGTLIVIGHVLGPVAVVVFSTARTISRSAYQAMQLVNTAVWPEMSVAFGQKDIRLARKLHRRSCQISVILCLCTICVITIFGNHLWRLWTVGRVATDSVLLNILLLQMFVAAFWFTSAVVPWAINKHQGVARLMLATTIFSLILTWLLCRVDSLRLRGAGIALVIGDALMAVSVLRRSLILVDDNPQEFIASIIRLPRLSLWQRVFGRT